MNEKQKNMLNELAKAFDETAIKVEEGTLSDREKLDIFEELKDEIASELRYKARKMREVLKWGSSIYIKDQSLLRK